MKQGAALALAVAERRASLIRVGPGIARYDGHSEWYDETFSAFHNKDEEAWLRECLGPGAGAICLDVACGTGRSGRLLRVAG